MLYFSSHRQREVTLCDEWLQLTIVEADDSLYAATIDGSVAMKLGPRSWSPGDCLPVCTAGICQALSSL